MKKSAASKYHMTQVVELSQNLWLEDMRKYKVSDFLGGGAITNNAYILNGDEYVLNVLSNRLWNVIYVKDDFFKRGLALSGYMYLADSEDGLTILHHEPYKNKNTNVEKPINLERNLP